MTVRENLEMGAFLVADSRTMHASLDLVYDSFPILKERDKQAISYHYNRSNDFYALWLDQRMVYSCAYFATPDDDLDTAQQCTALHVLSAGLAAVAAGGSLSQSWHCL